MSEKKTLGIYGGTFSPPHIGHIRAAEAFSRVVRPDRLLIIPSAIPPHKAPVSGADSEDRIAMCRLAFSHIENVEISDIEIKRTGRSYTVETLASLKAADTTIVMLVGTDMFLTLDTWYRASEIFAMAEIAVIRREEDDALAEEIQKRAEKYRTCHGARVHMIPTAATVISSSEVRGALASGNAVKDYLTNEVEAYIRKCHLYQV